MSREEKIKNILCSAEDGYNIIAPYYDSWHWQEFWKLNELPKIISWMRTLRIGYGADFGVGSGNSIKPFLEFGHRVDAFDISKGMLSLCIKKHISYLITGRLKCYNYDVRNIIISRRKYDWILCNRMLSNIPSVDEVASVMSKTIMRGGQCFISDIHPEHHYENTHLRIGEFNINIETYKHPINEVIKAFERCGFEITYKREYRKYDIKNPISLEKCTMLEPIYYVLVLKYGL